MLIFENILIHSFCINLSNLRIPLCQFDKGVLETLSFYRSGCVEFHTLGDQKLVDLSQRFFVRTRCV